METWKHLDDGSYGQGDSPPLDFEQLKKDPDFRYDLDTFLNISYSMQDYGNMQTKEAIVHLMDLIEKEIKLLSR
jgi:formate dehydrogenase maturation protein FdhE